MGHCPNKSWVERLSILPGADIETEYGLRVLGRASVDSAPGRGAVGLVMLDGGGVLVFYRWLAADWISPVAREEIEAAVAEL